jgi:hypothetical protein
MSEPEFHLRVHHPQLHPDGIAASLGIIAFRAWEVGKPRTTPEGRLLPGNNKETYCVFELNHEATKVAENIEDVVRGFLEPRSAVFLALAESGGRTELYVTWETTSNTGAIFAWEILKRLVALRISLAVEWFPKGDAS